MLRIKVLAVLLASISATAHAQTLVPLDEDEMALVVGREGVALDFEYGMNAGPDSQPLASLDNCQGQGNLCNLAITLNNRPDMWVMLKDMYGMMRLNTMWLDGGETDSALANSNAHADPTRFHDQAGNCLIKPGATGAACNANNLPALLIQYPGSDSVFEVDVEWHLYIGRATVQHGPDSFLPVNDAPGSFMSYQITDMRGGQREAHFDYDGRVLMFGW